jgi:hypothetical protein
VLSALAGALILGTLAYHAEIWRDDYPPDVRARAGPMSTRATAERRFVAAALLALVLGIPVWSTRRLRRHNGGDLCFLSAFLHAYGVSLVFNGFDAVVLDYLLIVRIRPRFVILPGTEGLPGYGDVSFHVVAFLKGLGIAVIPSLLAAALARRGPTRGDRALQRRPR